MSQIDNPQQQTNDEISIVTVHRNDLIKNCENTPIKDIDYHMFRKMGKPQHNFHKGIFVDDNGDIKVLFDRYN
jgi:hypothetical protein